MGGLPFASLFDLGGSQRVLEWDWFRITVANLVVIVLLLVVFAVAVALPFPRGEESAPPRLPEERSDGEAGWTAWVRRFLGNQLPLGRLLPSSEPAYVATWTYTFGVATLGALVVIVTSGIVLAFKGPGWHRVSAVGSYTDSVHFWSVQLFFFFLVLHASTQLLQASWRGGRAATWVVGMLALVVAVVTGLTGYLSQQNFEAQWIAVETKDGINAAGMAGFFNPLDGGQVLTLHVVLLPTVVLLVVALHILLVRWRGVVPPIDEPAHAPPPRAIVEGVDGRR